MALFGGPQKVILSNEATFEAIQFDASVSETHTNTAALTDHPVEDGADITDHIRLNPEELSMNVIVTNNPPIILASLRAQPVSGFADPATRAEDTHEFLRNYMEANVLVRITTTLREYRNMAITSMSVERNKDTSNIVNIDLTFRQVIIATTESVDAPEPTETSAGRAKKKKVGKKAKPKASAAAGGKSSSTLSKIFKAFK